MSADEASFTSDLRKLAADCGVAIKHCQTTGNLSRAAYLAAAREEIFKAVHTPGKDERQLTLDPDETQSAG